MPPLFAIAAPFLIGLGVSAVVAGAITTVLGTIALFAGLALLQSAFAPKRQTSFGQTQQVSFSPTDPRRIVNGQMGTAGALDTFQSYGNNNEYLILLFRVADHKCASLDGAFWQGAAITIGAGGAVSQAFADGHDNLWITFHNGDWNQAADSDMVANSGGRWTVNDRGRGIAYVKVKARYNATAFPGGLSSLFQFVFTITGMAAYDRRLDSSVGGSGSQRFNDQSTWTVSKNAAVVTENFLRGIRVEDTTGTIGSRAMDYFFGLRLTDSDLPYSDNVAAMNDCDTAISLLAGGTEPRYRVNGAVSCDASMDQVLTDLLNAQVGQLLTGVGRWVILPGVVRSPVRSFTDADLRLDGPYKYTQDVPLDTINNAVFGRFVDPAATFSPQPLPPRTSTTDEAADHGRKATTLDLPMVTSVTQGQRVQEITRRRGRAQKTAQIALAPENMDLEACDWITWESDRYGFTLDFEVKQGSLKTGDQDHLMVVVDLSEIETSIYGWVPSTDELSRTTPANLASAAPTPVAVASLTAVVTTIAGAGGSTSPALTVTCSALADATIAAIRFEYRATGAPAGAPQTLTKEFAINPATQVGTQTYTLADGVVGGYQYDVRATVIVKPPQDLNWSSWITTATVTAAPVAATVVGQAPAATDGTIQPGATINQTFVQSTDPALTQTIADGALWYNNLTGAHYQRALGAWVMTNPAGDGTTLFSSSTPGSWSFTVASTATNFVTIKLWGAGGGAYQTHGGGGGAYVEHHMAVTPGTTTFTGVIGQAGQGRDTSSGVGAATGGTSTTVASPALSARGGGAGTSSGGTAGTGSGGSVSNTTGEAGSVGSAFNGGAGANGGARQTIAGNPGNFQAGGGASTGTINLNGGGAGGQVLIIARTS